MAKIVNNHGGVMMYHDRTNLIVRRKLKAVLAEFDDCKGCNSALALKASVLREVLEEAKE